MCVIAYCENRKLTRDEFENCWISNDDGFGVCWREGTTNHYVKGLMSMKAAWKAYGKVKSLPHVAHFRITSTGKSCADLTHPFVVADDSPLSLSYKGDESLLFHNGTVYNWEGMAVSLFVASGKMPSGEMSDTRVAAMLVSKLGDKVIENFLDGKYILWTKETAWLYGNFEKVDGIYFSNTSYKPYVKAKAVTPHATSNNFGIPPVKYYGDKYDDEEEYLLTMGYASAEEIENMSEEEMEAAFFGEDTKPKGNGKSQRKQDNWTTTKTGTCKCFEPYLRIDTVTNKYYCMDCGLEVLDVDE